MLTGSLGYTLDIEQRPRIAVGYDYLSGREAGDEDYKTFDTLFATNHKFYGFMDYFVNIPVHISGAGLQDVMAKFQIHPHKKFTLNADVHQFMSAKSPQPPFSKGGKGGFGSKGGKGGFGQEVDLTAVYRYHKALGFTLGASLFLPGELMKARFGGNDAPAFWSYLMTTANF
ncbi:alginate export family protein [Candidatus Poribacteria bacterium]|nr:alginate export family protein [Candidatus Poribacteria bacterium]